MRQAERTLAYRLSRIAMIAPHSMEDADRRNAQGSAVLPVAKVRRLRAQPSRRTSRP